MNKEQKKSIRKFQTWQMNKFARNARKGYRFFQPDTVSLPTPRSAREAWGGTYRTQANDDRRQEDITTLLVYGFMVAYIVFLIWREFHNA